MSKTDQRMAEKAVNCASCGKNLALVGRAHNCVATPNVNNAAESLITAVSTVNPDPPTGRPVGPGGRASAGPNANAVRQAKWREANIETQRERSRSSMRKLREKKANV